MATILLTRPQAASELLAFELGDHGYQGVIEPLLTIVPTPTPLPDADCQAVTITSANALEALQLGGFDTAPLLSLPCFCVGKRTAEKAAKFGFLQVFHSTGDGADLACLIASSLTDKNRPVLHIAGHDIDSKAGDALRQSGFGVAVWEIYMAMPAHELSRHVVRLLQEQKIDAVLLFSARTAQTLGKLLEHHALEACCESLIGIGLSEAALAPLRRFSWRHLLTATQPTEDAVIARLKEILPAS